MDDYFSICSGSQSGCDLFQKLEEAKCKNEELESQFIQHGKLLLAQSKPQSLAAEMEKASKDEVCV